ncbi:MAG: sigma-54-dependent transcriptional regulator [bacterium]
MSNILIINNDLSTNKLLTRTIESMGHTISCAITIREGLNKLFTDAFDLVIIDTHMPDGNGIDTLEEIKEADSSPEILITGYPNPDWAEDAVKKGALDYIVKPFSIESLALSILGTLEYRNERKVYKTPITIQRENIIGSSLKIEETLDRVAHAAKSKANVLLLGETGTGKELFAQAIHNNSPRAEKKFIVLDCAALPESLVESTLFGHEKGAYTGAHESSEGLIKEADGGTLFLDEVGELPVASQKAFLRVIQERRFRTVRGKSEENIDFRLIAATNQDLHEMVRKGQFRKDLLFRLCSIKIELPPLRERHEDIEELAIYYINKLCKMNNIEPKKFSYKFLEELTHYKWPGNVRELINTLEEAIINAQHDPTILHFHLPTNIRAAVTRTHVNRAMGNPEDAVPNKVTEDLYFEELPKFRDFQEIMEKKYLQNLIMISKGSKKEACQISGLSRTRIFQLFKKYEISS